MAKAPPEFPERELAAEARRNQAEIAELLGDPVPLGGDATRLIREDRRSRLPGRQTVDQIR
jgi:hypothetical protein